MVGHMNDIKKVKFKGIVQRCVYKSDSFSVYGLNVDTTKYPNLIKNSYDNISICGELCDLMIDVEYEIEAVETDSKYGKSYQVINIRRDAPTTKEETYLFLKEILTENQAYTIVNAYPNVIELIKEGRIDEIDVSKLKGIGEKSILKIKDKIISELYLMDLVIEFGNILSMNMLKRIYDKYNSVETLKKRLATNPYTTLTMVSGIGFKKADVLVLEMQKEKIIDFDVDDIRTSADRCLACTLFLLGENENNGNTRTNLVNIRSECLKLVPEAIDHFVDIIKDERIYYNKETLDVALMDTYKTEVYIAETILNNVYNQNVWRFDIEKYRKVGEFDLSDDQMKILDVVCKNNIMILNGFGGSGKTYSTKSLIKMLEDNNKSYTLLSPTGRASKVLSENTNRPASTIHRGLGYMPPNNWTYNEEHKLRTDLVIVDEMSMVDIWLFKRLLNAIDFKYTKLLMIGDSAQIPSISAGNLLNDFMESNVIPTVTLNKIFRYSDGGLMKVASDSRNCKPYLTKEMKNKATTFGNNKDYMFVDLPSELIPKNAVALYKKLLDNGYAVNDIQVLTSKNIGNCGTIILNNMIQKVANPNFGSDINMKIGDVTYYEGDMILQCVNNYKAELDVNYLSNGDDKDLEEVPTAFVSNGEIGIVEKIYNTYMIINFDGVYVRYYKNDMNMVKLGYSINTFKAQGGGYRIVIFCTPQSDVFMLNSNLIYTGLTRMKEKLYHLGTLQTVNMAVKKKANLERQTFMKKLLTIVDK